MKKERQGSRDTGRRDLLHKRQVSAEVGSEALHHEFRVSLFEASHGLSVVAGALVRNIVPIHARQNHVVQPPLCDRLCDVFWLVRVEGWWCPGQVAAEGG